MSASKTYHTTFTEMDVNCEACHGPGRLHVATRDRQVTVLGPKTGLRIGEAKGMPIRKVQIETCAPCHSMRRIAEPGYRGGEPYLDYYVNELLHGHLYHADGQIMEEVYEYGSFTQSKMFQKGIRCSDCHDPHSTKVKFEGNKLCTSCHQIIQRASTIRQVITIMTRHAKGHCAFRVTCRRRPTWQSIRALTTACEFRGRILAFNLERRMPARVVTWTRGESQATARRNWANTPTGSRPRATAMPKSKQSLQRVDEWAAKQVEQWYGKKPNASQHFAYASECRRARAIRRPSRNLIRHAKDRSLTAMVRASCTYELGQYPSFAVEQASIQLLQDPEPLVRLVRHHESRTIA